MNWHMIAEMAQALAVNLAYLFVGITAWALAVVWAWMVIDRYTPIDMAEQIRDRELGAWLFFAVVAFTIGITIGMIL